MPTAVFMSVLRRHIVSIIMVTLLGAVTGVGVSLATTPTYKATSRIAVTLSTTELADGAEVRQEIMAGTTFIQSRLQLYDVLLKSHGMAARTVENQSLHISPDALQHAITSSSPQGTTLLDISVEADNASTAAMLANAVGNEFVSALRDLEQANPVAATVVQPAILPLQPIRPYTVLNTIVGAAYGFILVVAFISFLTVRDYRQRKQLRSSSPSLKL